MNFWQPLLCFYWIVVVLVVVVVVKSLFVPLQGSLSSFNLTKQQNITDITHTHTHTKKNVDCKKYALFILLK